MINKINRELSVHQIEELVDKLPIREKIRLARKLERETWSKRLDEIFKRIDERRKKYKISNKEISEEIEKARREFYARRR